VQTRVHDLISRQQHRARHGSPAAARHTGRADHGCTSLAAIRDCVGKLGAMRHGHGHEHQGWGGSGSAPSLLPTCYLLRMCASSHLSPGCLWWHSWWGVDVVTFFFGTSPQHTHIASTSSYTNRITQRLVLIYLTSEHRSYIYEWPSVPSHVLYRLELTADPRRQIHLKAPLRPEE
jgi:hypothetical protein